MAYDNPQLPFNISRSLQLVLDLRYYLHIQRSDEAAFTSYYERHTRPIITIRPPPSYAEDADGTPKDWNLNLPII